MARATKAQSELTRARILSTALQLFANRDYATVGLEEVASTAGVTRGAIYHHFESKFGLFSEVHKHVQQAIADEIERCTDGIDDPWLSLETGCRTFISVSLSDEYRRVLLLDGPAVLGWAAWRSLDASNSGSLLDSVLNELQEAGRISLSSTRAASALLSGAMNEAVLWIIDTAQSAGTHGKPGSPDSPEAEALIDEVWAEFRRLLRSLQS